jgi:hypothetical protein
LRFGFERAGGKGSHLFFHVFHALPLPSHRLPSSFPPLTRGAPSVLATCFWTRFASPSWS